MKKALVTGSSSGLGAALALDLKSRGFHVTGLDRNEAPSGTVDISIICDLADRQAIDLSLPAIMAAGPFDLIFMNAGVSATGQFETIPVEAQLSLLRINLEAPLAITQALLNSAAIRGPVSFISSLSHFTGYPGAASYAASKDGLVAYAKSLRKAGIKTTLAFPGPLDTPHAARHAPSGSKSDRRMKPQLAAISIIDATIAGRKSILPGMVAQLSGLAGWLLPNMLTKFMRKALYEKLDRNVW